MAKGIGVGVGSISNLNTSVQSRSNRPKDISTELNNFGIKKDLETQKRTSKELVRETISGEKGGPVAALKNQIGRNIDIKA